ncbi:MAG: protein kinase [Polyangiaceae bacterium]
MGAILAGKFRVERELGAGGMGYVLLAYHLKLEELVALKMLLPEAMKDQESVLRFSREAKAAARIKSEHVARVLDVAAFEDGTPYIVMEYLEGSDLEQILEAKGKLPIDEGVDYVLQACEALAEAHARGVVHRDLKPSNLHLSKRPDGSAIVKVLDFGISKIFTRENSGAMTTTSALLGSPLYMSPEQMKATRDVDGRSDVWAMGVVLYELLTARSPFSAPSMPQVCARVLDTPPDSLMNEGISIELQQVILKCLEKKPENRWQDISDLANALEPFAPERSKICIERIARTVDATFPEEPISNVHRQLRLTSPSAATMSEGEAGTLGKQLGSQTVLLPLTPTSPKVGGETLATATMSGAFLPKPMRPKRAVAYGAAGFAAVLGLLWMVHGRAAPSQATAEAMTTPSSPAIAAVAVDVPPEPVAARPAVSVERSSQAPSTSGQPSATAVVPTSDTAAAHTVSGPIDAAPTAKAAANPVLSSRPHRKAQDLAKQFGGRD